PEIDPLSLHDALPIYGNAITVSDSADTDVGGTDSLNTTLIVTAGVLSITPGSGALATGDGTASVSLQGTAAQINAALAGLTYTPDRKSTRLNSSHVKI